MLDDFLDRRGIGGVALTVIVGLVFLAVLIFAILPRLTGSGSDGATASETSAGNSVATRAEVIEEPEPFKSSLGYASNLAMMRAASVRNTNHDDSSARDTRSDQLVLEDHYGPRADYLTEPGGNPELSFPIAEGGQFRAGCEFSHFGYDDPLLFPGRPGASHLHMFFGNTDVNAFSTFDTLLNSGSSTCNGQELNRTGYWVPAMFDAEGNVRIPERIVVYYKGEGDSRGSSIPFPDGAALIATENINELPATEGGGTEKFSFVCSDNFSTESDDGGQSIPVCDGSVFEGTAQAETSRTVLEMNVKFPQCWNGEDPSDWTNVRPPEGPWYVSRCGDEFSQNLPNVEYFVNYVVEVGETTEGWFLSSDVDPTSFGVSKASGGSTVHGDWWGGWNAEVAQMWIDNCVNFIADEPSGCGFGYLTDGGPDGAAPVEGPALLLRPQYEGPQKVPAEDLFEELCAGSDRDYAKPEDAAYCVPDEGY